MARKITVQIVGDASSLERSFKRAGDSSQSFGKQMGLSMKGLAKAGAVGAAAAGVAVVTKQLFASVAAAKESQAAEVRLNQAFKATGASRKQMAAAQAKINEVSKTAALDDEDLSDSLAAITRSTGSAKKGMEGIALAANIARGRNVSLSVATKAVEKAMLGSDTALKRLGISVPKVSTRYDTLKEKVNALQDRMKGAKGPARDLLEAQIKATKAGYDRARQLDKEESAQSALTKAQRKFAGSAEDYGKTAAGAQAKLSVAFENLQERLGAKLLPVITNVTLKLVDLLDWSEKNWPRFSKAVTDAYNRAKPVIAVLVGEIKGIGNMVAGMAKIVHGIVTGDWAEAWNGLKQYAVKGIGGVVKAVASLPLKLAKALGRAAFAAMEHAFEAALNRIIGLINKAISAYNKIPLLPDIGTVPTVGATKTKNSGARTGTNPPGVKSVPRDGLMPRTTSSRSAGASTSTPIVMQIDGREVGRAIIPHQVRQAKGNAAQTRGRSPGRQLGLA